MPRPRFHKLLAEQQQTILRAALEEFAAHGFVGASLNRIIDEAGISKGSMYYYFDDKADLYAHVVRVELGRLFDTAGPFSVPDVDEPKRFWDALARDYLRLIGALFGSPHLRALARDWLSASGNPRVEQVQKELEHAAAPWFEKTVVAGQHVGAVRKDVPRELLIAIVLSLGQTMDTWLMTQQLDAKQLRKTTSMLIDMFRRALAP